MKKFTAIALMLAIAGSMAGCGSVKTVKEGGEVPVLKVYMPSAQQKDLQLVVDEANKILEPKIGAKIDMVFIDSGAYTEKMNMKLASKEKFDVCFTSSWLNPYEKAVENESFYPLTELIDKNCPNLWKELPEYYWEAVSYGDEVYAVPNQQIVSTKDALTMNKKWADKYNLDVDSIKTVDDIEPFLQQIKDNEPDVWPMRPYGNWWVKNYSPIISCVGLDNRNQNELKAIFDWEAEGYEHGLEKLREYFLKGYFRSDVASVMDDTNDFKANKYVVTGTGWKPGFEANQSAQLGGEHIAIILGDTLVTRTGLTGTMYAISANSENPDKAIQFINLMNTDKDLYNLFCYGIEGMHYDWVDSEHIKVNDNGGYHPNASWKFGDQFNAYILEGQDPNIWEESRKINEQAKPDRTLQFRFDTTDVQTEISQLETIISEYKNMLTNGAVDWKEHFEEYKTKMKRAGADNLLNEVQRQLDEFAKSQNK